MIMLPGTPGDTIYLTIWNSIGQILNGTTPEAFNQSHWSSYVQCTGVVNTAGLYAQDFPAGITTPDTYVVQAFKRVGGAPSFTDDKFISAGTIAWTGTAEVDFVQVAADAHSAAINTVGDLPGTVDITWHVRDASNNPVPNAQVQIGLKRITTDNTGVGVFALDPGSYVAFITGDTLGFPSHSFTVIANTPQTITITASAIIPPSPPPQAGYCIVYIPLLNPLGKESATIEIDRTTLPANLSGQQVVFQKQHSTYDVGPPRQLNFAEPVPQGVTLIVNMTYDGNITSKQVLVPVADYFAILIS